MGTYTPVIIAGIFGLVGVLIGWLLSRHDDQQTIERKDAITLAQVAASISKLSDGQAELWKVADQTRGDIAYIAGRLTIDLPTRR